jgi:4-hydroxybenzoate polyprenyltransferase
VPRRQRDPVRLAPGGAAGAEDATEATHPPSGLLAYLGPFRVDHWIKNLVVVFGSVLALVAHREPLSLAALVAMAGVFVLSGLVSSVNYAVNEVLDAPFDARHPVKRLRPIPSGRVRPGPLMGLATLVAAVTLVAGYGLFSHRVLVGLVALLVAGLLYNLPPLRLKDWPYLDAITESVTNPVRLTIGWAAVSDALDPPAALLASAWAFGAFLMAGKRLAELRALGVEAARYRATFRAYSVRSLLTTQVLHAVATLVATAALFATEAPRLLPALPVIGAVLGWTFKMTFEEDSPLVDPEHLYRRPLFLLVMLLTFAGMVALALL